MPRRSSPGQQATPAVCEKCHGYGWVIDDKEVASRCDCGVLEKLGVARHFEESGIPPLFRGKDFSNFKVPRGDRHRRAVLDAASAYAQTFHRGEQQGLLLRGCPGCGKTHIAVSILKAVITHGFSGRYANVNDLLSRLRDTYNANSPETEGGLLAEVDETDILVLDDLGAESVREWMRDRLYLIINRRYENARATIITTNCNEAELEAHVGPRTASRLYEMCSTDFPAFPPEDYRKANMR